VEGTGDRNAESPEGSRIRAVIIPSGWGQSLHNGDPKPVHVVLDGTDTNTAPAIEGVLQGLLGEFQMKMRDEMIDNLPDQVFEMGRTLATRSPERVWLGYDAVDRRKTGSL